MRFEGLASRGVPDSLSFKGNSISLSQKNIHSIFHFGGGVI
jgi:hypothetical protein